MLTIEERLKLLQSKAMTTCGDTRTILSAIFSMICFMFRWIFVRHVWRSLVEGFAGGPQALEGVG